MNATVASLPLAARAPFREMSRFLECARELAAVGRDLAARGWVPATSGNFSVRLNADLIAITASGKDKGSLTEDDILVVDLDGGPVSEGRPSAETGLHTQLYRHDEQIGAVLHTHSLTATLCSRLFARRAGLHLENYELLKAFAGITSHESSLFLPVVPNNQDIDALAGSVSPYLHAANVRAYLIEGHGVYVWGRTLVEARRHLEALEFLLAAELEWQRWKPVV